MEIFICPRCSYETHIKQNFERHLHRKKICKNIFCDISAEKMQLMFENKEYDSFRKGKKEVSQNSTEVSQKANQDQLQNHPSVNDKKEKCYECRFCVKIFKHKQSRFKHEKKCCQLSENKLKDITPCKSSSKKSNKPNTPARLRGSDTKFVYLIREREFCRMNEHIYKIGKSCEAKYARLDKYPKWSEVISIMEVSDEDKMEKIIIEEFQKLFVQTKYGNEYFEGDRLEIKKAFHTIVFENDWNIN